MCHSPTPQETLIKLSLELNEKNNFKPKDIPKQILHETISVTAASILWNSDSTTYRQSLIVIKFWNGMHNPVTWVALLHKYQNILINFS